jgi:hypothetical protein
VRRWAHHNGVAQRHVERVNGPCGLDIVGQIAQTSEGVVVVALRSRVLSLVRGTLYSAHHFRYSQRIAAVLAGEMMPRGFYRGNFTQQPLGSPRR